MFLEKQLFESFFFYSTCTPETSDSVSPLLNLSKVFSLYMIVRTQIGALYSAQILMRTEQTGMDSIYWYLWEDFVFVCFFNTLFTENLNRNVVDCLVMFVFWTKVGVYFTFQIVLVNSLWEIFVISLFYLSAWPNFSELVLGGQIVTFVSCLSLIMELLAIF